MLAVQTVPLPVSRHVCCCQPPAMPTSHVACICSMNRPSPFVHIVLTVMKLAAYCTCETGRQPGSSGSKHTRAHLGIRYELVVASCRC
jgi:hypothetical protein